MSYMLLIPGWFPSRINFLTGDFIERHAKAASHYFPVKVLFVVKDNELPFGTIKVEHQRSSENYEAFIYYYSSGSVSLIEKVCSVWLQSKCLYKGFKKITNTNGLPSLIHSHVLLKHAWFALRQSKKYNIPLLASEQWTGYLPEARGEFESLSSFQTKYISKVLHHAVHVTTVSEYLAQQMRKRFDFADHTVIPNLVDTAIFQPSFPKTGQQTTFIHISTLSAQKNFDDILEACSILKSQSGNWQLYVVAPANDKYSARVDALNLSANIVFKREVQQSELSKMVAQSNALILYSNYETFGCVIVEANACGVPVIVSDFPVFDENVQEDITGFKVPLHDPVALANRMLKIINKQHSFNHQQIRDITDKKYSVEAIGEQFAEVYSLYAKP